MASPYESQLEHIRQAALIDGYAHATFWANWSQVINFVVRTKPDASPDIQMYTAEKMFFEKNWNEPFWGQDPRSKYVRQSRKMWFKVLEDGISRRRWDEVWAQCEEISFGIGISREADHYLAERWVWRKLWPHDDHFPGKDPRITPPDGPVAASRKYKGERDGHETRQYSRRHSDRHSPFLPRRSRSPAYRRQLRLDEGDSYRPPPSMKREPSTAVNHLQISTRRSFDARIQPELRRQDASLSSVSPITPQNQKEEGGKMNRRHRSPLPSHTTNDPVLLHSPDLHSPTLSHQRNTSSVSNLRIPNPPATPTALQPAQSSTNAATLAALKQKLINSRSSRAKTAVPFRSIWKPQFSDLDKKREREMGSEDEDSEDSVDTVEFTLEKRAEKKMRF